MADEPLPFPEAICHTCAASRYVRTGRSVFILCTSLVLNNKYPRQPVTACVAHAPRAPGAPR